MTMHNGSPSSRSQNRTSRPTPVRLRIFRLALAGLLGIAVPLLVSCGSSGAGLIPAGNAGPLRSDFETVAQAAKSGNGSCTTTEEAILKTEHDFLVLPSTVDRGLRNRLHEGIAKLRSGALGLCKQPLPQATATTPPTNTSTRSTSTTPTITQTTTTQTTPTSTPTTSGPAGGTPAPGTGGGEAAPGAGSEQGGAGEGATRPGGGGSGGAAPGAGGLEGGK